MKKLLTLFIFAAFTLLCFSPACFAEVKPVERPEVKFVAEGAYAALKDTPLSIGGKVLLPLKPVLAGIGIPNDSAHVKWDAKNKSMTILFGTKKIVLKAGSRTVTAGGTKVNLDTAPLLFSKNQKLYVPVSFFVNVFNKASAWDDNTSTVYIRDRKKYDSTLKALQKVDSAMNSLKKLKMGSAMKLSASGKDTQLNFDVNTTEQLDRTQRLIYSATDISLFKGAFSYVAFYRDNNEYLKGASDKSWNKTYLGKDRFDAVLAEDTSLSTFNSMEVLAAAMVDVKPAAKGELHLKGEVYPKGLVKKLKESMGIIPGMGNIRPQKYIIDAVIDSKTNLVKGLVIILEGQSGSKDNTADVKVSTTVNYSEYEGNFEVQVPEGLTEG